MSTCTTPRPLARIGAALRLLPAIAAFVFAGSAHAVSLDPALLPRIQQATFEVVAAKPDESALKYERALPMELIPFQERNDKYHSIGTAFAIGNGRYVTAAHVLTSGMGSLWGPPALRDNDGKVYAIDKLHKFSLERDFVVFSLVDPPARPALELDADAKPGQTVFTVGNAFGTGIVVRDGLYTSDTPEQQDGRWNWMRFSAPASPGNSGGPLVDAAGRVIGVVVAKSPNENLNFSLPIGQVQSAPDGVASIDVRSGYQFDVFDSTRTDVFKAQLPLPATMGAFFQSLQKRFNGHFDQQLAALLAAEPQRTFPNGPGSQELLHRIASMGNFPLVVARNDAGNWVAAGEAKETVKIGANGFVSSGTFGKSAMFQLRRPDDIDAARFYGTPALVMEQLLKAGYLKREVGHEKVAVTSLGPPSLQSTHVDKWGRGWRVWEWGLPYANYKVHIVALPVPDGYVGALTSGPAVNAHDHRINVVALTDFIYANYDGTLAQWKQFLADPALHPAPFKRMRIDFEYGKRFDYASDRMRLGFDAGLQPIRADGMLTLGFAFFPGKDGKPVWDVAELWTSAKGTEDNYVMAIRHNRPPASIGDDYASLWDRLRERRHPYDGKPRPVDDTTRITTIAGPAADRDPSVLYSVHVAVEGQAEDAAMRDKLQQLLEGFAITDP